MTWWLGSCAAARTVTLIAVSSAAGIVSPGAAEEGCGSMTGAAIQSGRDMGGFMPFAVTPSWQEAQLLTMPVWLKPAPMKLVVVWQTPQSWFVGTWLLDLPVANAPS